VCQKLQDPAVRPTSIGLLREVTGGTAIGRARLRVHPEVQKDTKNRHIAHLGGYMDGIHQLQANFSCEVGETARMFKLFFLYKSAKRKVLDDINHD
jgi:hypothetical protein